MSKRTKKIVADLMAQAEKWEQEAREDRAAGRLVYAEMNEERAREARRDAAALQAK